MRAGDDGGYQGRSLSEEFQGDRKSSKIEWEQWKLLIDERQEYLMGESVSEICTDVLRS